MSTYFLYIGAVVLALLFGALIETDPLGFMSDDGQDDTPES